MRILLGASHLTTQDAAEHLGVGVRTLIEWRKNRKGGRPHQGPPFIKVGRKVFYLKSEIEQYAQKGDVQVLSDDDLETDLRVPLLPLPR